MTADFAQPTTPAEVTPQQQPPVPGVGPAGAARILTSGGSVSAPAGIERLARLVAEAKERIIIVPGGGINASNASQVVRLSAAREIHSGLGSVLAYGEEDYDLFEGEVRKLVAQLASGT